MNPGWIWSSQTWWSPARHAPQRPQAQTNGTVTRSPTCQPRTPGADLDDRAGQLVPGDVRQRDVRVVAHPAVPVAAAQAGRPDRQQNATRPRRRERAPPRPPEEKGLYQQRPHRPPSAPHSSPRTTPGA